MNLAAFTGLSPSLLGAFPSRGTSQCGRRRRASPTMQIPPDWKTRPEPPLDDLQKGPADYEWDPTFPGTLKPGRKLEDCFPLETVLESKVYERMVYEELDMYAINEDVHIPDDDLLAWLSREGRLLGGEEDDDEEGGKQAGVTEEELDFSEEDDKMLAYYSKQGEGSSVGASSDFGGMAESGFEAGGGL